MGFLLIWDIDGTLIQGRGMGRRAMDRAFLDLYGIPGGFNGINMAGGLDSLILCDALSCHGIENRNHTEFFNKYCEHLRDEVQKLNDSVASPGVIALLELLNKNGGFCNALGTGNIEKGARIKLEIDGLNRFFPTGGFGDEPMERWQVIEKAIFNSTVYFGTGFESENIYIIGDTPKDIECGKRLSVKTIGTATGPYTMQQLADCGADFVFSDLSDVHAFLEIF